MIWRRIALERYRSFQRMAQSYSEQVSDQQTQVEGLKTALQKLEQKLVEAKSKKDLLIARHRHSQVAARADARNWLWEAPRKLARSGE